MGVFLKCKQQNRLGQYCKKKIYKNQLDQAGITIGEADVWDEIVNAPFVQNNPQYQNEVGMFDENKFKQF